MCNCHDSDADVCAGNQGSAVLMAAGSAQQGRESDEVLCAFAQSGSEKAEAALYIRFFSQIRFISSLYYMQGADSDDLMQEGLIGFFSAVREFNPDFGVPFRSFAETCIKRQIYSSIKTAARKKHSPLNDYIPLTSPLFEETRLVASNRAANPEELVILGEERLEFTESLRVLFTPMEAKILDLYLMGLSYKEIAERIGRQSKSVDNAVQRIRRKLQQHLSIGDSR